MSNQREEGSAQMTGSVLFQPEGIDGEIVIDGLRLVLTCFACPEQYDVFDGRGRQVGYLRLRHGWFRADVPRCGGETVYAASPRGDGIFDDDERHHYLSEAVSEIRKWIKNRTMER